MAGSERAKIRDHTLEFMPEEAAREIEDTLWWRHGRQAILRRFLLRAQRELPLSRILEVGCGSGGDLAFLSLYGRVTGVEPSPVLVERARARGAAEEILVGDFLGVTPEGQFELTCLLDVIEHIEDDDGFVKKLNQTIRPGQLLLISVPACPFLYGPHDELLHHYRRYSKRSMNRLLERNGYRILSSTYFVFLLFPVVLLQRLKERLWARVGRRQTRVNYGLVPAPLNALLTWLLKLEAALARWVDLPIGAWYIVLARRVAPPAELRGGREILGLGK